MLNCTDLACVLHHHHFYAHLHQLKHHLQDDSDDAGFGNGSNVDTNDNTHPNANETGSELSSLSHVDAPSDVVYIVCGVVIAMILVGLVIVLVAVTINKLRKREESSPISPITIEAQQPNFASQTQRSTNSVNVQCGTPNCDQQIFTTSSFINASVTNNTNVTNNQNSNNIQLEQEQVTFVRTSGVGSAINNEEHLIFPPKVPTPHIFNCMNNHSSVAANDKNGFKGLRKQFSGRFKRLVAKKGESTSAIPPELKPQLKTIYVY